MINIDIFNNINSLGESFTKVNFQRKNSLTLPLSSKKQQWKVSNVSRKYSISSSLKVFSNLTSSQLTLISRQTRRANWLWPKNGAKRPAKGKMDARVDQVRAESDEKLYSRN